MPTKKAGKTQNARVSRTTKTAKTEPVKPVSVIPKAPFDASVFQRETDWEQWYHEFSTERTGNGMLRYSSAFAFAQAKGTSRPERDFILHTTGPIVKGKTPIYNTQQFPQHDWESCRKKGYWLGPEGLKDEIARVVQNQDNLDEMRSAAREFLLPLLATASRMYQKVEQSFEGGLFNPNATAADNEARAKLYMRLMEDVTANTIRLNEAYARSLGINMGDIMGTIQMRETLAVKARNASGQSKGDQFLGKVLEMVLEKSDEQKLELIDEDILGIARKVNAS